jgi:DNA polymerase
LRERVAACTACSLCHTRTQTVFADGSGKSGIVFVGEAPGEQEDRRGLPFVGPAGQLLTDIIEKGMGLSRAEVYICNVLKCRPPENRDPTAREKELCTPWLDRQLDLLDARLVIALGRHAACHLLATESSLSKLRGRIHLRAGRKVLVTYHPAYLLRSPADKKECWRDIQLGMKELGLAIPDRRPRA